MTIHFTLTATMITLGAIALTSCGDSQDLSNSNVAGDEAQLRAASLLDATSDTRQVRYTITPCEGDDVIEIVRELEDLIIPGNIAELQNLPLDENSEHLFADHFQTLEPGCYDVHVQPLNEDGENSEVCAPAWKEDVEVSEGETTEIFLMIQCAGDDPGAIDAIAAVNHEPNVDSVYFPDSKFICGPTGTVCIDGSDADNDPLEFELTAPDSCTVSDPEITGDSPQDGLTACFKVTCDEPGKADLRARVYDLAHSGGDLIRVEDWLELEGYPNDSHGELDFFAYFDNDPVNCSQGVVCDESNDFCDTQFVNTELEDGLTLSEQAGACGFVWVAVSSKGTVVKIDVDTGDIVSEFLTHPSGSGDPSRTTVDANCSMWVTNRRSSPGTVTHIGATENAQCEDRNGDGIIQTSTGLDDIRPWTNSTGPAPRGVGDAEDECIVNHTDISAGGARHVSVDSQNNVWVSGTSGRAFDYIQGGRFDVPQSGEILHTEAGVGLGGYGGLITEEGILWSTQWGQVLRWDTTQPLAGSNGDPDGAWTPLAGTGLDLGPFVEDTSWSSQGGGGYGLCKGPDGHIWQTTVNSDGLIHRFTADGEYVGGYDQGHRFSRGCVVGDDGNVWIANSGNGMLTRLDSDGTMLGQIPVGRTPTGASIDFRGNVWATVLLDRLAVRIDPDLGAFGQIDFTTVDLGGTPYNYSDMTGRDNTAPPGSGTATTSVDANELGSLWTLVEWSATTPGDSSVVVDVRSSDDGITWTPWTAAVDGATPAVANGRYLEVRVVLIRGTGGESPSLDSFRVNYQNP